MSLSKMLEDYRNKKREFPTYEELVAITGDESLTLNVENLSTHQVYDGDHWIDVHKDQYDRCNHAYRRVLSMTPERFAEKMDELDKANPAPLARLMAADDHASPELTDAQIDAIWKRMNGDTEWLRTFGYQQFAQAILDAVTSNQDSSATPCTDPIVERNVSLLRERSTVGVKKYGTTLADNKLPLRAWLNHALEEALDQANYLQEAMAEIDSAAPQVVADERALPPMIDHPEPHNMTWTALEVAAIQQYARAALAAAPVQAQEPVGYINPAFLTERRSEFEQNGTVMFAWQCGECTSPVYRAPVQPVAVPDGTSLAAAIKDAVNRFLGWKLPKDFGPDCGISFDGRKDDEFNKNKSWPTGTNLLTADQGKAMFEHCIVAPAAQDDATELTDSQIKAVADNYARYVQGAGYDVTHYECPEDFYNCVRACAAIAIKASPMPQ